MFGQLRPFPRKKTQLGLGVVAALRLIIGHADHQSHWPKAAAAWAQWKRGLVALDPL